MWFLYPETAGRSLEEMNLMFTSPSLLVSKNMKEYHRMVDEADGSVAVAARRLLDEVDAEYAEEDARADVMLEEGKRSVLVEQVEQDTKATSKSNEDSSQQSERE
jgi:hypothetical protein